MSDGTSILLYVNGRRRVLSGDAVLQPLLTYLRRAERLTGSKLGCGEGGCGACTVLLSSCARPSARLVHRAVNACLLPVAACDACAVTTIEAVGDRAGRLAPVQAALVDAHGSQCGFCTPGIVMSMFALLRQRAADGTLSQITDADVEHNFDGNLCRCTGYRPILDAFKGLARRERGDSANTCALGQDCCRASPPDRLPRDDVSRDGLVQPDANVDGGLKVVTKEYIFPPELVTYKPVELNLANGRWLRPVTLDRLVKLKQRNPDARIIVGNTELGIEEKFKGLKVSTFLCATHIDELLCISQTESGVNIGSSVTWTQLNDFVDCAVKNSAAHPDCTLYKFSSLRAIQSQLRWFAGKQIRNVAAVGGNIVTASPISDVNPLWIAAGASFVLLDADNGNERSVLARDFFISYRKVDMKPAEVLIKIFIPWNESPYDVTHAFKTSRRRDDDIAIVSAGIRIRVEPEKVERSESDDTSDSVRLLRISHIAMAFGGLAPTTISLQATEQLCMRQLLDEQTLRKALKEVGRSAELPKDVPGGMPEYRQSLALGFVFKAFALSHKKINAYHAALGIRSAPFSHGNLESGLDWDGLSDSTGQQVSHSIQISSERLPESNPDHTGKSVKHLSAALQVSGEAKYLDDVPAIEGELQAALVMSTEPHARLLKVDLEEAGRMPGVIKVVTLSDLKGENVFGPNMKDELCFADETVTTVGQIIAVVTAETLQQAKDAAKAVKITYETLPAIITIEEAIEAESFAPNVPPHAIQKGDCFSVLKEASLTESVVEGTVRIGAQEHWYLEPQGTIALPEENGEMVILSSTQAAAKTQEIVAKVLGEPMHKVLCKVKRLGGGFGGKESRSLFISAAVAVAAQASRRPVRLILDRDTDMLISGTRHAFLGKYKAAFEANGRITALQLRIFLNMGNSADLSIPVLDRSLFHGLNCYDIPNVDFIGRACYTHTASATAFRGFGAPQGMMIAENVIEHVAWETSKPAHVVREINLFGKYGNSETTHFGMSFNSKPLVSCWDTVIADSCFEERRKEVENFNGKHRFRKRGISIVPTMFGISFTFKTYNQAGALVHIFHGDGSVLVSHGGVEMGQGLHTKICQVAATALGLPLEKIFISETATDKVPNASPTAASSSSDLYGMAVKRACEELNENIRPSRLELGPEASWEEVVHHAWFNRVSLSATGFYKTPELDQVDLGKPNAKGRPFFYYTNGAAVSEVEVDLLTGESVLLRTDIAMDVGRSLNPAVDVGQIEGAFVQGLGWCTMEEVVRGANTTQRWMKSGQMYTLGPSTYKIPGFTDIPKNFRVRVLDTRNEKDTIHSSKAIGEPPLFLAASTFFAIREAIKASRVEGGYSDWFGLDSPASVERIRLAAVDPVVSCELPNQLGARAQLSL